MSTNVSVTGTMNVAGFVSNGAGSTTLSLVAGDTVTLSGATPSISSTTFGCSDTCEGQSFTATSDGLQTFNFSNSSPTPATLTLTCGRSSAPPAGGGTAATSDVSVAVGAAQGAGIADAVGAAIQTRFSGGGIATRGIFLSTRGHGGDSPLAAFISLDARAFEGRFSGSAATLTLGADMAIGPNAVAGLLASVAAANGTLTGVGTNVTSVAAGPYFGAQFGGLTLEGYLTYGRPRISAGGPAYSTDRTMGALRLSGTTQLAGLDVSPFASLTAFQERHPAHVFGGAAAPAKTVRGLTTSLGGRVELAETGGMRPYVSLAAEYIAFDDGLGTRTNRLMPRLGAGFSAQAGNGALRLDLDSGSVGAGTRDLGARVSYSLRF
ncbi:MAG: autotransporter domain-containing protein [Rhodobacteraceae bacterium]|nr:autotransporter domain-containing protein [Paracoccaceae bacterium]